MVKQADLDGVVEALKVQGQTIAKIYDEVTRLKSEHPELDITGINAALAANKEGLDGIDNLNPDVVPETPEVPAEPETPAEPEAPTEEPSAEQ